MAKDIAATVTEAAEETVERSEFPLSLDEFCAQLSQTDKRVESIGAFHTTEKAAGRVKDLASAYAARFSDFLNKPM